MVANEGRCTSNDFQSGARHLWVRVSISLTLPYLSEQPQVVMVIRALALTGSTTFYAGSLQSSLHVLQCQDQNILAELEFQGSAELTLTSILITL